MTVVPDILRKSHFASLIGVSPQRVDQYIRDGKIGVEALVGEGRAARLNVAVAQAHLRERLDPNQRFGSNGLSTNLSAVSPPSASPATLSVADTVEAQLKTEKLLQAQLQTSRLQEQDRLSKGVYVLASDARAETARAVSEALNIFEGALSDFASALAAKYALPQRDVVHLLRTEFRAVRARASAARASEAASAPEHVPVEEPMPASFQ